MASLLRMGALPRLYSRIACRTIQTTAVRKYNPVPTVRPEHGSELAALQAKEKGPWTELSKEEKIKLYRAQFEKTIPEEKVQEPYMKQMIGVICVLLAISVGLFSFLKKYVGPQKPRTLTPEWEAAADELAKKARANPISGITSKA